MKGFLYTALFTTALIGFVAVSSAQAQLPERLQFTTSFGFTVGSTHFTPGTYTVAPEDDNNLGVLRISNRNGRQAAIMMVVPEGIPSSEPKDNELTFERFGDTYILTQIWDATDQSAMEPTTTEQLLRHEPRARVAERLTVPFIKVS
jgi:hypothetical protein